MNEVEIRAIRKSLRVLPCVKQINTLAAEFPAQTNYLYMTYSGYEDDATAQNIDMSTSRPMKQTESFHMLVRVLNERSLMAKLFRSSRSVE